MENAHFTRIAAHHAAATRAQMLDLQGIVPVACMA